MHAIVETGGKQYRVASGDVLRVATLSGDTGSEFEFSRVLAVFNDGQLTAGADLGQAKVKGTIVSNGRAKKIIVFKFKRKKHYKKTQGHRQDYTEVRVGDILV